MKILEATDYREFLKAWVKGRPGGGRGELQRLARYSGIHTSTFSQIMSGTRGLIPEQAALIGECIGLNRMEMKYLTLLVQLDGDPREPLKGMLMEEAAELRNSARDLEKVLRPDGALSESEKAIFYSAWYYCAARILSSIPGFSVAADLEKKLGISPRLFQEALRFLIDTGLVVSEGARLSPGPNYTHISAQSPLAGRHHANWRIKAMERHPSLGTSETCYTAPMSLSEADARRVQELVIALVEEVQKIRKPSDCETAYCLNIDWFKF